MQIYPELDSDSVNKLTYIQQQTQQDVNELIKTAIDYYHKLQHLPKTPLEALTESGFIGCGSVESDRSVNDKAVLQEELQQPFDPRWHRILTCLSQRSRCSSC